MRKPARPGPPGLAEGITPAVVGDAFLGRIVAMVLAYWLIGREIVEEQQRGEDRAEYGQAVMQRTAETLTKRYGRGFSERNIRYFRSFYLTFVERRPEILQSSIAESARARPKTSLPPTSSEGPDTYALAVALPARRGSGVLERARQGEKPKYTAAEMAIA